MHNRRTARTPAMVVLAIVVAVVVYNCALGAAWWYTTNRYTRLTVKSTVSQAHARKELRWYVEARVMPGGYPVNGWVSGKLKTPGASTVYRYRLLGFPCSYATVFIAYDNCGRLVDANYSDDK